MVEINELVFILIIIYIAITIPIVFYIIDDYIDKKQSEESKRGKDLHYIKEDLRLMKRDLTELKMKEDLRQDGLRFTTDAEGLKKFINRDKE